MIDCVFCNIIHGKTRGEIIYTSDDLVAFRDIDPQAPVHILIVPKEHIPTANDLTPAHASLLGRIMMVAKEVAQKEKVDHSGYRLILNCNRDSGQEIYHLHFHLLGGRRMSWPPG